MKNVKNILIVTLVLVMTIVSGCSSTEDVAVEQQNLEDQDLGTTTVTDMAGRTVEIPTKIEKVYCKSPISTILVYTLAPEKLAGWNYGFTENEKKYLPEKYANLPVLGGWFGKNNTGNIEEILKADPDIIIDMGEINDTEIDADETLQKQIDIPIVIVRNEKLDDLANAYTFIGEIIGEEKRAEELAGYCRNTIDDALEKSKELNIEDRVKVYYAEGAKGLNTEPKGSYRMEVVRMVGGENVAQLSKDSSYGHSNVSLEQVLLWNPDVIITVAESSDDNLSFFETIYDNEEWKDVKAVKNKKVYGIPQNPFGWFDRPPSVNRVIGIKWVGNILYPEIYDYDMVHEVKNFYKMFYHYDLSDEEARDFLNIGQQE
ncbi:ABC transporter substrate-binding protein [Clostridiisalibacter paucivorans]|uniref:ABC transporter substrate-binding protein n=1 Tax=Clostridiisalibacter paucivorans TaxID=408753 RepID=UPI000478ED75|nr:ABC transporter substrate-binding protein [Clostridiisalibacter paucivorans]